MSVPKQRHTKGRRDRRRVRFKIEQKNLISCSHCKRRTKPHQACPYCGFYKGKEVYAVKKSVKGGSASGGKKAKKTRRR